MLCLLFNWILMIKFPSAMPRWLWVVCATAHTVVTALGWQTELTVTYRAQRFGLVVFQTVIAIALWLRVATVRRKP